MRITSTRRSLPVGQQRTSSADGAVGDVLKIRKRKSPRITEGKG